MAIKPANSKYHTFTFNGVRAADYGIYVTDVNVFNSAARDVEYIEIPGRDGAFALDRGRFQNISVVYKCAMTQDTDEDFATAISEFRNAIASTKGYKRLEDDIHTDEYRMGVFSKGLEAPTLNTKTATFDVEFNCQPQRFLKSGETAVSVASGGTINNPTLFESHPLLQVWGYGSVLFNESETLTLNTDVVIGRVVISNATTVNIATRYVPDYRLINNGDNATISSAKVIASFNAASGVSKLNTVLLSSIDYANGTVSVTIQHDDKSGIFQFDFGSASYQYPPAHTTDIGVCRAIVSVTGEDTNADALSATYSVTVRYSVDTRGRLIYYDRTIAKVSGDDLIVVNTQASKNTITYGDITAYSTKPALGAPTYIDTDIGEAYYYEDNDPANGGIISANASVSLPAQLPALKSGDNTITYDNTITQFKVVPRWWEV